MKRFLLALLLVGLELAAQTPHSNTLTWTPAATGDPATGFRVWKSSAATGPFVILQTLIGASITTYTDTLVAAGQTNYYYVTAFNGQGDSTPSNTVTCVTPFQAPGGPTNLSGTVR